MSASAQTFDRFAQHQELLAGHDLVARGDVPLHDPAAGRRIEGDDALGLPALLQAVDLLVGDVPELEPLARRRRQLRVVFHNVEILLLAPRPASGCRSSAAVRPP